MPPDSIIGLTSEICGMVAYPWASILF